MTLTDDMHAHQIAEAIKKETVEKIAVGVMEHGGCIWEKPAMLDHAVSESIDLGVYLRVARNQHALAKQLLSRAIGSQDWTMATQAFNVLALGNPEGRAMHGD